MKSAHVALTAAAFLCGFGGAQASPFDEARIGVLAHGVGPFTQRKEHGAAVNLEVLFSSPEVLSFLGAPRPVLGASLAFENDATNVVYAGLAWRRALGARVYAEAGLAAAAHDGETKLSPNDPNIAKTTYFGCRVLFRLSADLGYRLTSRLSVSAHFDHMSNAGLCHENEGLDNAGVRLGLSF